MREAEEEIGLQPEAISTWGVLPAIPGKVSGLGIGHIAVANHTKISNLISN